jgi:prepilin-type N-terminal cleavage/methylation domain-containing protein
MRVQTGQCVVAGFTLIELVISSSLMALILVSAYLCLHAGLMARKDVEPRIDVIQSARVALALMTADLRGACPLSPESEFVGIDRTLGGVEADNIDFATHHHTPRGPGEGDYCQVSYFIERDPDSGELVLWRRRNPVIGLNPLAGGRREEIARGLRKLKFEYYDGLDWYDTWGDVNGGARAQGSWRLQPNLYGMPEAVRITLWLDQDPTPVRSGPDDADVQDDSQSEMSELPARTDPAPAQAGGSGPRPAVRVFQTVARLNLAPRYRGTSGSTEGTAAGPSTGSAPSTEGGN